MITSIIGFFSPKAIRNLIIVAIVAGAVAAIWGGYNYIQGKDDRITELEGEVSFLNSEKATLEANIATLESSIADQQQTIASLERDIELQAEIFQETQESFQQARDQVDSLRMRLGQHEIGALGRARPGLVENVINDASDAINRCFEIAAGAELTQAEISATRPSQINRECPELANPNYEGN